jgi:hypothetical protein
VATPRRGISLAKKAMGRLPAVVAAQNLLMCKLDLSTTNEEDTQGLQHYIQMLVEGMTVEQAQEIDELFVSRVPMGALLDDDDDTT